MVNRQFYTLKFRSSKLKELGYRVDTTFDEAFELGEVIALADNQMLRSIREIRKRTVDKQKLERLYAERKILRKRCEKKRHSQAAVERLQYLKNKINRTMFVHDYITVVMDHPKHYTYIFEHGIYINGKRFIRFSCSAGQARVSTVVLVCDEITDKLNEILDNGRNKELKFAPSKFNAYKGCYSSGTYVVSKPRIAVVKDYEHPVKYRANWDTEQDWDLDDKIEVRDVEDTMKYTDGMGLISPAQAEKWAKELGLDYIPAQWVLRQSFLKGMICTFPFHEFCEEVNGGNYIVDTIYKDADGNYVKADLREVDVIVTESQFKLWDSYASLIEYEKNCDKHHLLWGVTSFTPKRLKDVFTLNYQFIQTLNLDQAAIEELCSLFVEWIRGVSYSKPQYMLLFLVGINNTEENLQKFLRSSDKWWIKAIIANPEAKNDPFIKRQIREMVVNKIKHACMGQIPVLGNFQTMVSDPYAFMQNVCGLPVTGLLQEGEFYNHYWNERGVSEVNTARSPQTYRCENIVAKLVMNEKTEKWYRYDYAGFIINVHGHEYVNWGGSDCDKQNLSQ